MGKSIDLAVADLRTALVEACNASGLPITVLNLLVTDLLNEIRAKERTQLQAQRDEVQDGG